MYDDAHESRAPEGARMAFHKSRGDEDASDIKTQLDRIQSECSGFTKREGAHVRELSDRIQNVEQQLSKHHKEGHSYGSVEPFRVDTESLAMDPAFRALQRGEKGASLTITPETKAVKALFSDLNGTDTSHGTFPTYSERAPGFYGFGLRRLSLLDVLPVRPIATDSLEFAQLSFTGDADYQDGEGAQKPEMDFDGDLATAKVETIAVHTTASAQVLADVDGLLNELARIMVHKVRSKAESRLVTGSGSGGGNWIDGLYSQSVPLTTFDNAIPDRIGEAIVVMDDAGYLPSLLLLNPGDWHDIRTIKDSEGRYLW